MYPIVSPAILQQVENLPPCTNPDFDLGMSESFMTQSSLANESQVGMKRCATSCEMDDTTNKKRLRLSLQKNQKPTQKCFSSVTCEEVKEAAKGVVPANTKSSNEWALKNLRAWVSYRNARMSDEAVPDDLLVCEDADILCTWMCCFVQEMCARRTERTTHKHSASAFQRILRMNKVPFMIRAISVFVICRIRWIVFA